MNVMYTDNRFEIIAAYKKMLIERTNIKTSPDEMAVIDNVLFRFWQLGWLPSVPHGRLIDADALKSDGFHAIVCYTGKMPYEYTAMMIDDAPTIVEAEGVSDGIHGN